MQESYRTMKYDYLIVGAGLFGSTFARLATDSGKTCLVIDKRQHLGGNVYCENVDGIIVHKYGPHIFHTSNEEVFKFITSLVNVNPCMNTPMAHYNGKMYNMPFNMNTFCQMWGIVTPQEARQKIAEQSKCVTEIRNLEDKAISLVGKDIYRRLIKGYTEKQWGRPCTKLPASIITRLPVRFTFDNRYYNDRYEFIPVGGYNTLIKALLRGIMAVPCIDFFNAKKDVFEAAEKVVFTGRIDEFYDYRFGELEYRSLLFKSKEFDTDNYQGNAVINYTSKNVKYTRTIEHRHFEPPKRNINKTVVTYEYPASVEETGEPYYPINDERNTAIYQQYKALADNEEKVLFGGRLAEYRYYDMDDVIESAMKLWKSELNR